MEGNQILDEVGEREEVDIVKDKIKKRKATKSVKAEKVQWETIQCVFRPARRGDCFREPWLVCQSHVGALSPSKDKADASMQTLRRVQGPMN